MKRKSERERQIKMVSPITKGRRVDSIPEKKQFNPRVRGKLSVPK